MTHNLPMRICTCGAVLSPLHPRGLQMGSATMWLGIAGGVLMALLMSLGVKGGLVIGIFFVTIISWIPGHSASYLGEDSAYEGAAMLAMLGSPARKFPSVWIVKPRADLFDSLCIT